MNLMALLTKREAEKSQKKPDIMGMPIPDSALDRVLGSAPIDQPQGGQSPVGQLDQRGSNSMKYLDFIGQMKGMNPIERIPMILRQFGILK